jgi:hypothetical protein
MLYSSRFYLRLTKYIRKTGGEVVGVEEVW